MSLIGTAAKSARGAISRARLGWRRLVNDRADAGEVFDTIYRRGEWGDGGGTPFSGTGSRGQAVERYVDAVAAFASARSVGSIVDIGCGDFFVGARLLDTIGREVSYLGLDVSSVVIDHNTRSVTRPNVRFERLDASKEEVPAADLCLVRQVMQHLSNAEIAGILRQLARFNYAIVTEHQPLEVASFNADKPHGGDTRLSDKSAVFLDKPPFNVTGMTTVLEVPATPEDPWDGKLVSLLIEPHMLRQAGGGRA